MGHEYSSSVIIGFTMEQEEFLMPFKTVTEEKFHMEERFNPKTGKKLPDVKVIDQASEDAYLVEGETYEYEYDALDAIASIVGCNISSHGDQVSGDDFMVGIEPKGVDGNEDGIPLAEIPKLMKDCKRIKTIFSKKFGINLDEPVITTLDSFD